MPVSLFWTVRSLPRHMLSGLHPKPTANPAQHPQGARRIRKAAKPPTAALRIRFGKEEQGSGRMTFFCSVGIKERRSKADFAPTWRSGWDSNPRALADNLISSQARYDHFDTAAYLRSTVIMPYFYRPCKS